MLPPSLGLSGFGRTTSCRSGRAAVQGGRRFSRHGAMRGHRYTRGREYASVHNKLRTQTCIAFCVSEEVVRASERRRTGQSEWPRWSFQDDLLAWSVARPAEPRSVGRGVVVSKVEKFCMLQKLHCDVAVWCLRVCDTDVRPLQDCNHDGICVFTRRDGGCMLVAAHRLHVHHGR